MARHEDLSVSKLRVGQIMQGLEGFDNYESLAAAKTLTKEDNGKTFGLNLAGGFTATLPAHSTISPGYKVRFRVETAPTTAYIVAAATADVDTIVGGVNTCTAQTTAADFETAGADQVNFVASQAVVGDWIEIESNGTNWFVEGNCSVPAGITLTG